MLTYELLFGKGDIQGGGKAKGVVVGSKARLTAELARLKAGSGGPCVAQVF